MESTRTRFDGEMSVGARKDDGGTSLRLVGVPPHATTGVSLKDDDDMMSVVATH